jgi:hypothetical protein
VNLNKKLTTKPLVFFVFVALILIVSLIFNILLLKDKQEKSPLPPPLEFKAIQQVFGDNSMDASIRACLFLNAEKSDPDINAALRSEMDRFNFSAFTRGSTSVDILNKCMSVSPYVGLMSSDFDQDGLTDILIFDETGTPTIYYNDSGVFTPKKIENLPPFSGTGRPGFAITDANSDGLPDFIVLPTEGNPIIYVLLNRGGREFAAAPIASPTEDLPGGYDTATSFDINKDGLADIVASVRFNYNQFNSGKGDYPVRIFMNNGNGSFTETTTSVMPSILKQEATSTIAGSVSNNQVLRFNPFTPLPADFNNNGLIDLFIAGDFGGSKMLYQQPDGRFIDFTEESGVMISTTGMGAQVFDFNNDGLLDIFTTESDPEFTRCVYLRTCDMEEENLTGNKVLINQGDGTFVDEASKYNLKSTGFGWGYSSTDLNMDGVRDFFIGVGELTRSRGDESWMAGFDKPFVMVGDYSGSFLDYSGDILRQILSPGTTPVVLSNDFNGDFLPDIVYTGWTSNAPYFLANRFSGNFKAGALKIEGKGPGFSPTLGEGALVYYQIPGKPKQTILLPSSLGNFFAPATGSLINIGFADQEEVEVTVIFPSGVTVKQKIYPNQVNVVKE